MDTVTHIITEQQTVMRLLIAAFLGALIGLEREHRNQPAGLRTHMILSIGSCLAMCMSIVLAMPFRSLAPNGDPARLAAQVISGIGFLGAGAIIKFGANIKGLTTATSLWTVAIVGLTVGAGHFFSAVTTTLLLLLTLTILGILEKRWLIETVTRSIKIRASYREDLVSEVKEMFKSNDIMLKTMGISRNKDADEISIEAVAAFSDDKDLGKLVTVFSNIRDVKAFEIA
jgi:putative Mg2+ transporter-C (MgtC) family protein